MLDDYIPKNKPEKILKFQVDMAESMSFYGRRESAAPTTAEKMYMSRSHNRLEIRRQIQHGRQYEFCIHAKMLYD